MALPYLSNGFESLRAVEWGKSFNWDIKFDTAPKPFNEWFPATEVERGVVTVNSHTFSIGANEGKIPLGEGPRDLRLTFHDDDKQTLERWLEEWAYEKILDKGMSVATLDEACRQLTLADLNSKRELVGTHQLMVYPEGNIQTTRDSQSGMVVLVVSFVICGHRYSSR